ncbi:MAG: hemerythrin domain-containing protein [Deltaproteobacteria bacterium]|nr:hemerythrin domain-containing protein [Deltaproteobacteria bacterium]
MISTTSFREQHKEMLAIAGEISKGLNVEALKKDASNVRTLLSRLAGKLSVHLAMEDNALYPALVNHQDASVRNMANGFVREMGGIKKALDAYTRKWATATLIQNAAADFVKDTRELFTALARRIGKEDNELYAVIDRLFKNV